MPSEARIVVLGAGNDDPSLSRLELLPAAAKVSPRGATTAVGGSLENVVRRAQP